MVQSACNRSVECRLAGITVGTAGCGPARQLVWEGCYSLPRTRLPEPLGAGCPLI